MRARYTVLLPTASLAAGMGTGVVSPWAVAVVLATCAAYAVFRDIHRVHAEERGRATRFWTRLRHSATRHR